jgi:hypothetical protein
MNWDMIGAISELLGAVAVTASLVYLARQIGLSNRLSRAEAWRSRFSELTSVNAAFGVDPRFHRAMVKVYQGALEPDLHEDEVSLVSAYTIAVSKIYEQLFREVRAGLLDDAALDDIVGESIFAIPFYRAGWSFHRRVLDPAFVRWVEQRYELSPSGAAQDRS